LKPNEYFLSKRRSELVTDIEALSGGHQCTGVRDVDRVPEVVTNRIDGPASHLERVEPNIANVKLDAVMAIDHVPTA
jgi:hypothetical protein